MALIPISITSMYTVYTISGTFKSSYLPLYSDSASYLGYVNVSIILIYHIQSYRSMEHRILGKSRGFNIRRSSITYEIIIFNEKMDV